MFEKQFNINYSETSFGEFLQLHRFFFYGQETSIADTNCKERDLQYYIDRDMGWIYLGWTAKIYKYPKYDEKITFTTAPISFSKVFAHRGFTAKNEKGETIFEGVIKLVLFDLANKSILVPEQELLDEYDPKMENIIFDVKRVPKITDFTLVSENEVIVYRHNTDSNKHTNNIAYIQYAEDFIPSEIYKEYRVSDVVINFKKESFLDDKLIYKTYLKEDTMEIVTHIYKDEELLSDLYFKLVKADEME